MILTFFLKELTSMKKFITLALVAGLTFSANNIFADEGTTAPAPVAPSGVAPQTPPVAPATEPVIEPTTLSASTPSENKPVISSPVESGVVALVKKYTNEAYTYVTANPKKVGGAVAVAAAVYIFVKAVKKCPVMCAYLGLECEEKKSAKKFKPDVRQSYNY
jgi:hypothetical protein